MRARPDHRQAAFALRRDGRSYDEIACELGVSKGSLSLWLRGTALDGPPTAPEGDDVPGPLLAQAVQLRAGGALLKEIAAELSISVSCAHRWTQQLPVPVRARPGRSPAETRAMARRYWDGFLVERDVERSAVKDAARDSVGGLTDRELELVAVTAYWCEGSKDKPYARREAVVFINSDPSVIRVWREFLRRRGIDEERLRFRLSIHESADLVGATAFWAGVVGAPVSAFSRPSLKRHNATTVRKNVGPDYVGCLVIRVLQARLLYQEIEGLWRGIAAGAQLAHCQGRESGS